MILNFGRNFHISDLLCLLSSDFTISSCHANHIASHVLAPAAFHLSRSPSSTTKPPLSIFFTRLYEFLNFTSSLCILHYSALPLFSHYFTPLLKDPSKDNEFSSKRSSFRTVGFLRNQRTFSCAHDWGCSRI